MTKLNEKGFNKAYWEFTNAIGFPEAFQKTTSEKLETAILAYLPYHESELVKALEGISAYPHKVGQRGEYLKYIAQQALSKYKEGNPC